jgi:hypothetical protein
LSFVFCLLVILYEQDWRVWTMQLSAANLWKGFLFCVN